MKLRTLGFGVICVLAATTLGCGRGGPVYTFVPTSGVAQAYPPGCDFQVAVEPPTEGYKQLGILEMRRTPSTHLLTFKKHVQPEVCAAGGDLVVGEMNGYGYYVRAIVYQRKSSGSTSSSGTSSL